LVPGAAHKLADDKVGNLISNNRAEDESDGPDETNHRHSPMLNSHTDAAHDRTPLYHAASREQTGTGRLEGTGMVTARAAAVFLDTRAPAFL
jgi:hypothetical protein